MTSGLPKRVAAVAAHPDDIELGCAGTLALFRRHGAEILVVVACRGNRGGETSSRESLAELREQEAKQAADLLGAEIRFLRLPDAEIEDDPPTRELVIAAFREFRPELVLTHGPSDYHHDHRRVSEIVTDCCWYAASPGHRTAGFPPLDGPIAAAFWDDLAGIDCDPSHLTDISDVMDLKLRMLACHRSQLSRNDSGMDRLEELARTLARTRGLQAGVRFAEGFRVCRRFGRRRPEPLFPWPIPPH